MQHQYLSSRQCQTNADCSDIIGSYECSCSVGFTETPDGACVDIDECADGNVCDINATCSNTSESYYLYYYLCYYLLL